MIVDTSALVAIIRDEPERKPLSEALLAGPCFIPAPVVVEFERVSALDDNEPDPTARAILASILIDGSRVEPFSADDARLAADANAHFGSGNGRGGTLNMLDLMVYGMARRLNLPILCTGRDFAATDIAIHPASRAW